MRHPDDTLDGRPDAATNASVASALQTAPSAPSDALDPGFLRRKNDYSARLSRVTTAAPGSCSTAP